MSEKHLFEYAVIRIVPRVEREEFFNAGIILFCQQEKFLSVKSEINFARIKCFSPEANIDDLNKRLTAFQQICSGGKDGGPIGEMSLSSRFRWLTSYRSTVIQTSRVHPGLCENAQQTLNRLFLDLVL